MMRATTLKATAGSLAGLVAYYSRLREEPRARGLIDYYLDSEEPAGRWWGQGARELGLDGEVAGPDLRAVLDAAHPASDAPLGRPFGDRSARGFDATFSAPKSVSVLWAVTPDPWVRAEVLAAHDAAVDAALTWYESHGAVTRRGHDGVQQVDARGITAALFRQHTSRTVDPQLHTHALISAKVQEPGGRWLALDARFLKYQQRTIGWIYDAALRTELTTRLGVEWGEVRGGQADLRGIPFQVREAFSQRSVQVRTKRDELIARWTVEHDGTPPDPSTISVIERRAVLASRPAKEHGTDAADLHRLWSQQATELGVDLERLREPALRREAHVPSFPDTAELIDRAIAGVSEESSTWLGADLARHLAALLPVRSAPTADYHVRLIDDLVAEAVTRCIDLGPERPGPRRSDGRPVLEHVTERRLTTSDILEQERDLEHWARSRAHPVEVGPDLQEAATAAMVGPSPLVLVVGPAGTGKTMATARAVEILQRQGQSVVGLAPSGKAADVLRTEAGCPTETVAGFLTRHRSTPTTPLPPRLTIVLDEAGMITTKDLAELSHLARQNYWRLVAVGDPAQLPAVGRGGMFARWCDTVPHYELEAPRRFTAEWEAEASLLLRAGRPASLERYATNERVHSVHPATLPLQLAETHACLVEHGYETAITTTTRSTALAINEAIQQRAGRDRDEARATLADTSFAYAGDTIATRRNDRELQTSEGQPVRNRQTWVVDSIERDGSIRATDPDRGSVRLPADYVAEHVELGWAVTGYGNQGDTVDVGIAVVEPGTNRNHLYVAMTRGREANHAWVLDEVGDHDPVDLLRGVLEHEADRGAALSVADRLHREAGVPTPEQGIGREIDFGLEIDFGR